jgi:hypothetical protein
MRAASFSGRPLGALERARAATARQTSSDVIVATESCGGGSCRGSQGKVALAAVDGENTLAELAQQYDVV